MAGCAHRSRQTILSDRMLRWENLLLWRLQQLVEPLLMGADEVPSVEVFRIDAKTRRAESRANLRFAMIAAGSWVFQAFLFTLI